MMSKRRLSKTIFLVSLLQYVLTCAGQSGLNFHVIRQYDGDVSTRIISSASNSSCDRWFAVNVQPFSKENCSVQCKCKTTKRTYNVTEGTCVADEDILKVSNCNGSFLPSSNEPLYDLSKSGKAQLNVSFPNTNNQSYCRIARMAYLNGTNETHILSTNGFNISRISNGSALLTWDSQVSAILSKVQPFGFLLKVRLLCNDMTSQKQRSCFIIKTRGGIKEIAHTAKEHRNIYDICKSKRSETSANVMLLYILVGFGCCLVLIVIVISCYACYKRRRRPSTRQAIPRISSRSSAGTRKVFKTRSVTKNNEPTTPAIHDVIFNELSWDTDGGFSNRALADPRVLDVDYGIPIDFGTLPRLESSTSIDSNRNSLSPLTDIGERSQTKT